MALILMESFDHYNAQYGTDQQNEKGWNGAFWQNTLPATGFMGQAVEAFGNHPVYKILPSTIGSAVVGFAFKLLPNALWDGSTEVLSLGAYPGGARVCEISISGGYLKFTDSAAREWFGPAVATLSWIYCEFGLTVGASEAFSVHLNGAEVIADTGNFGSADIDRVTLTADVLCHVCFDDIYILDSTGPSPLNDFLGPVTVRTLYPRMDGSHTDWTPLTGPAHYPEVNEREIDGDGSYVYDASAGDKDSYYLNPITAATVYACQLNVGARKGDATTREIAPLIRQSATDYDGPTYALSNDYLFYSWQLGQDPSGSDWLDSTINTDEFGAEVIT